jgi:hypothetical protein
MEVVILFLTFVGLGSEIEKNTDHIQALEDRVVVLEERLDRSDTNFLRLSGAHSDLHARHEVDKQDFSKMFEIHGSMIDDLYGKVEPLQD